MAKAKPMEKLGGYLFLLGLLVALGVGVANLTDVMWLGLLALFGLIVGFLNIADKEIVNFLIAVIALTTGAMGLSYITPLIPDPLGGWISGAFGAVVVFAAAAVIIPALKVIYNVASGM